MRKIFAVCAILALTAGAANAALLAEYAFGMNGLNNSGTVGAAANGIASGGFATTPDDGSATANAATGVPYSSALNVGGNASTGGWLTNIANQLTISLWSNVNWTPGAGANFATFCGTSKADGSGFFFGRRGQNQEILFASQGTISGYYGVQVTSTLLPTDGAWHHYVATYNGTTAAIYVDGILLGSRSGAGNINLGVQDLYIGNLSPNILLGASWRLGAYIDDFRLYNNAFNLSEIQAQLAAGRTAAFIPEPTTMALFGLGALGLIRRKRA